MLRKKFFEKNIVSFALVALEFVYLPTCMYVYFPNGLYDCIYIDFYSMKGFYRD